MSGAVPASAIVDLPTLESHTRATLHLPTGLLIVSAGGDLVCGSIDQVERRAAEMIAACWEARRAQQDSRRKRE